MKCQHYQCDICGNLLQSHLEPKNDALDGVGVRFSRMDNVTTFIRVKVQLADHHFCGRCLAGLREFLKETSCLESVIGNSPSSES
jgi:hypothetical protein